MALAMSILVLSACSSGKDFWGNPVPSNEPNEPTCAQPEVPPLSNPHLDKPADTPPGHNWVTYGLSVIALSQEGDNNYCIPVEISYTKSVTEPDLWVWNRENLPATVTLTTATPWLGFVSFDYDPTLERFRGRPPTYRIELSARYLAENDRFDLAKHVALACRIHILGAPVAQDIAMPPNRFTCRVELTNDRFNLA